MLALLLALASPELELRGISVSYGNTVVENAYRNTVEIMRRAGKRITLGVGARRPLKQELAVAHETHGASGLGYAELPPAGVTLDWVKSLDRLLVEQPEPVTLITLGPISSLALALRPDALAFEEQRIVVDLSDGEHRGHTRVKPEGARGQVATQVEMSRVRPLLSERVFRCATRATTTQTSQEGATV